MFAIELCRQLLFVSFRTFTISAQFRTTWFASVIKCLSECTASFHGHLKFLDCRLYGLLTWALCVFTIQFDVFVSMQLEFQSKSFYVHFHNSSRDRFIKWNALKNSKVKIKANDIRFFNRLGVVIASYSPFPYFETFISYSFYHRGVRQCWIVTHPYHRPLFNAQLYICVYLPITYACTERKIYWKPSVYSELPLANYILLKVWSCIAFGHVVFWRAFRGSVLGANDHSFDILV